MRLTHALLVIVDISGYTQFITQRTTSLLHAEQIVTELLEAVIDRAEHPLTLNKLQGDAALLYREYAPAEASAAAQDVLGQIGGFFAAFASCRDRLAQARSGCPCEACSNTANLALKAFVHVGEIAIKQVRQFEELAGEAVIFVHRLMKNRVASREYVLMGDAVRRLLAAESAGLHAHREAIDGFGEQLLWLAGPDSLPSQPAAGTSSHAVAEHAMPARAAGFRNLPRPGWLLGGWLALKRRLAS